MGEGAFSRCRKSSLSRLWLSRQGFESTGERQGVRGFLRLYGPKTAARATLQVLDQWIEIAGVQSLGASGIHPLPHFTIFAEKFHPGKIAPSHQMGSPASYPADEKPNSFNARDWRYFGSTGFPVLRGRTLCHGLLA